jgi:hypothetical protein
MWTILREATRLHRLRLGESHRGLRELQQGRPVARSILLVALAVGLPIDNHRASAEDTHPLSGIHLTGTDQSLDVDLVLLCPQGGATVPQFQNQKTGKVFPISDPRLRAIAEKACRPALGAAEAGNVNIANNSGKVIYVGFTPQAGSSITWGPGCGTPIRGLTVQIPVGGTCQASVTDSVANPGSRFCAATSASSSGLDCSMAQQNNQTLIETYFQPAPCFGAGTVNCIWYDISVIPATCTNQAWSSNMCAGTGGASYNLPVSLACSGEPTYICQGPTGSKYGSALYPINCGNPNASCVPTSSTPAPNCDNAYFFPAPSPQPNAVCPNGQTLTITFLTGS